MIDKWLRSLVQQQHDDDLIAQCGTLKTLELTMPGCSNDNAICKRQFDVYVPLVACDQVQTNILPLVFAVHCLGCHPNVMSFLTAFAETYSVVLVIPHGIDRSFNAQHCCGHALEQNIDDAGFFENIISVLSVRYNLLISKDVVYGFGWSNGGYMVARTAHLFRAVAPISGYQVDLPALDRPVGLFMHHSETDLNVLITGCCNDPTRQSCCCGLSNYVDHCESAMHFFQEFGANVNQCTGKVRSISMGSDSLSTPCTHCEIELDGSLVTETHSGVTCYQAGSNCKANTTLCIHTEGGHFNRPSFEAAFPMTDEVFQFFARHACESIGDGTWSPEDHRCGCRSERGGATYCLDQAWEGHVHDSQVHSNGPNATGAAVGAILLVIVIISFLAKGERKYRDFKIVSTFELSEFSIDEIQDDDKTSRKSLSSRL